MKYDGGLTAHRYLTRSNRDIIFPQIQQQCSKMSVGNAFHRLISPPPPLRQDNSNILQSRSVHRRS